MRDDWVDIGCVRVPSGQVIVVDPGYLVLWCHDRAPTIPGSADAVVPALFQVDG